MADPIDVTLVTGFLGAGKTTLVNHLLATSPDTRFVVVENEFGDVGIDGALVNVADDALIALDEGCVCCDVRDDLVEAFADLAARPGPVDHVLVEASGLAEPAPVMRVIERAGSRFRLNGVIALVDALHIEQDLAAHHTTAEQLVFADVLVLNKTDLVDPATLDALEAKLRAAYPLAEVVRAVGAAVPPEAVLGIGGHAPELAPPDHDHHHHGHGITSVAVDASGDVDIEAVDAWLGTLLRDDAVELMRTKGWLSMRGVPQRFAFHVVREVVDVRPDRPWGDTPRGNRIVFIGRGLDATALQAGLDACVLAA
jgi:G3E family GTPase